MCSIDCGNVINTLTADICRVPMCVFQRAIETDLYFREFGNRGWRGRRGEHVEH